MHPKIALAYVGKYIAYGTVVWQDYNVNLMRFELSKSVNNLQWYFFKKSAKKQRFFSNLKLVSGYVFKAL